MTRTRWSRFGVAANMLGQPLVIRAVGFGSARTQAVAGAYDWSVANAPNTSDTLLYHYTDANGLLGIINEPSFPKGWRVPRFELERTLRLWATDVRFLNDTQELRYAGEIFARRFSRAVDDGSINGDALSDHQKAVLRELAFELTSPEAYGEPVQVFAACLSEEGDQLSQWRGYAGGTGGYSIGFSRTVCARFTYFLHPEPPEVLVSGVLGFPPNKLVKVSYDVAEAEQEADRAALTVATAAHHRNDFDGSLYFARFHIFETMAGFKHKGFDEEKEWRLITHHAAKLPRRTMPVEFRAGARGAIPYLSVAVNIGDKLKGAARPDRTIEELVVGPSPDQNMRVSAVQQLLEANGHDPDVVRKSDTPYRG